MFSSVWQGFISYALASSSPVLPSHLKSRFGAKLLAYLASVDNLCSHYISLFKLWFCPCSPEKPRHWKPQNNLSNQFTSLISVSHCWSSHPLNILRRLTGESLLLPRRASYGAEWFDVALRFTFSAWGETLSANRMYISSLLIRDLTKLPLD